MWGRKRHKSRSAQKRNPQPRGGYPWWMLTLASLGVLGVLGVVVTLFFTLGRRPGKFEVTESPPADSIEFLTSLAGNAATPLRAGGNVRLLNNGEFFPAFLQAIRGATRTINVFVYIWEPGRASDQVVDALCERARAGIGVRVLLDGIGGFKAPREGVKKLRDAGVKVETFRSARPGRFTRLHMRNHRRAIVIDGKLGFTGGEAIDDQWLGDARSDKEWRDFMVEVTGPLASTLQSGFAAAWAHTTGEILAGPSFFISVDAAAAPAGPDALRHVGVVSAPSSENHPLRLFFFQTFAAARRKLYITTPYFVPERAMRVSVADCAKRGVDVRVLLPDDHTDATMIRLTSQHYYETLMEAGVRIYEYKRTMLHSKSIVVDGIFVVVGSANLDIRSQELNDENVLGIRDAAFAREMEATFLRDLQDAREILLPEWRKRGLFQRLKEVAASRLAEQY